MLDDTLKNKVIELYTAAEPTPESSTEIVKEIAEELSESPNRVRMLLVQAGVYIKKDATTTKPTTGGKAGDKPAGETTKRVSKESQIDALKAAITARGGEVDEDILSKLTGKAAAYFTTLMGK